MKKRIFISLILLVASFMMVRTNGVFADKGPETGRVCPACSAGDVLDDTQESQGNVAGNNITGKNEPEKFRCFNCDRRPCVATKEAWIRLWQKYMGTDSKVGNNTASNKEDRK